VLALMVSASRMGRALQENRQLRESVARPAPDSNFAGDSLAAKELLKTVARIAPLDSTVLITGESGVGKGLLARMIHRASKRARGPFITTSCPALPRELLESEMFGHERGAFTGAQQRRLGRIELAEGGTLFLDEIGDLPLLLQPKLLNVLQDRQFTRVGGSQTMESDIRLIAATNVYLQKVGSEGLPRGSLLSTQRHSGSDPTPPRATGRSLRVVPTDPWTHRAGPRKRSVGTQFRGSHLSERILLAGQCAGAGERA
jgi:transcriptional regulator with GAF, ATPase, and Fis domain